MPTTEISKGQNIDRLTGQLADEYAGLVDPAEVAILVRSVYEQLHATSRITAFVPILAERRVRAVLRRFKAGGRPKTTGIPKRFARADP